MIQRGREVAERGRRSGRKKAEWRSVVVEEISSHAREERIEKRERGEGCGNGEVFFFSGPYMSEEGERDSLLSKVVIVPCYMII